MKTTDDSHSDESSDTTSNDSKYVCGEGGYLRQRDHPSEYTVITSRVDGEDTSVLAHQLLACVDHDPHTVFADGNVVHHEVQTAVPVDIPSNLRVMDAGDHARGHADGTLAPTPIAEVLNGE